MEWRDDDDEGDWAARYDADALPIELSAPSGAEREDDFIADGCGATTEDETTRAVLGDQCAICLHALEDPVMIERCYHVYCRACLATWVRNLILHGVRTPTCPLCKQAFTRAYADVVSETSYSVLHFDGGGSSSYSDRQQSTQPSSRQDDGLERRSMVYRKRMRLVRLNGVDVPVGMASRTVKTQKREFQPWLERELRACVGPLIDLTVLLALVDSMLASPVQRQKNYVDWTQLQVTLAPFLLDDTELFVRELSVFMSSRLNMHAYDNAVEYCCSNSSTACSIDSCCSGKSI